MVKKHQFWGVSTLFPVITLPPTGQNVVTKLFSCCVSTLIPCKANIKQRLTTENHNFLSKYTKKGHFRSQGGLGVITTHVIGFTLMRPTILQQGADTLNPQLHAQNWHFPKFWG